MNFRRHTTLRNLILPSALIIPCLLAAIGSSQFRRARELGKSAQASGPSFHSNTSRQVSQRSGHLILDVKARNRPGTSVASDYDELRQRALNDLTEVIRKQIALPVDVRVSIEECGQVDSYYDEDTREITICYELFDAYYSLFAEELKGAPARAEASKGAAVLMFLHEVAHALIHTWDLPITGREEDAADQFAALWLINQGSDGEQMTLNGAQSFKLIAANEVGPNQPYWDAHSLDEQRYYDTICLVYGHQPEKYEYLVRNGTLPIDRAENCERDYARLNKSWQTLLAPHFVGPSEAPIASTELLPSGDSSFSKSLTARDYLGWPLTSHRKH